jgi:tRNA A37 threonylcarbamoyltransferase TsaD
VTAAWTKSFRDVTGGEAKIPLVFTGGVTANTLLRNFQKTANTFFATAELAGDNAVGAAVLLQA